MAYRQRKIQKKVGGKIKRYKNLATFLKECPKRSIYGNICELTNIRKLADGSGLATVKSTTGISDPTRYRRGARPAGTWLLHFASHDILKQKLKGRVDPVRSGMLDGTRRRR
jgi:hypothetical protein